MSGESSAIESGRARAKAYLARSLALYALVLVSMELIGRVLYRISLPQLAFLAPERARALVEAHFAEDLVFRIAFLSLPLLTAVLIARWHAADPMGELGLRGMRALRELALGLLLGGLAYHLAWAAMAALAGSPSAWGAFLLWLAEEADYWREPKGLALLALGLCYAMGRVIIPFGHLQRASERLAGPRGAVGLCAVVFALPHLASAYVSPLCLLNLLLAGAGMAVVRLRGGTLGVPLGLVAGWTAVERTADLALSDSSLEHAYAASLPTLITGGFSGVAGSLLLTMLLCAWLAWMLRPRARGAAVEGIGEARPEGFEPPAP